MNKKEGNNKGSGSRPNSSRPSSNKPSRAGSERSGAKPAMAKRAQGPKKVKPSTKADTAPMVNIFMENLKEEGFRKMLKTQFVKYTDACVENFLGGDMKSLFANTKQLSKVVLNNFKPMIPEQFHGVWQRGIDTNDYYLKLCGSGGGGYILGFTKDLEKAKRSLKDYKLEVVYQF